MPERDADLGRADRLRRETEQKAKVDKAGLDAVPSPDETLPALDEENDRRAELERENEELGREREKLEASLAQYFDLYDLAPVGYLTVDKKGVILEANRTAATLLGVAKDDLVNQPITRFISSEDQDAYRCRRSQLCESRTRWSCEIRMQRAGAATFWCLLEASVAAGSGDASVCRVAMTDITERKERERESERLGRLYSALSLLNRTVVRIKSREELFQEVCRILTDQAGFRVAWVGRLDGATHAVTPIARAGADQEVLDKIEIYADDRPEGRGPTGTCLREGKTRITNDFFNQPVAAPWRAAAAAHGLHAVAALPIFFLGGACYSLTIYDSELNAFQEKEAALLAEVTAAVSSALESLEHGARRQRAEQALRESEHRYRSLFDNMLEGVAYCRMLFDDEGRPVDFVYLAVNNAFKKLTTPEDVGGKRATEVTAGIRELNPGLFETLGRVVSTGEPEAFEIDFKPFDVWPSASVYSIEKGCFAAVFENITDRKRSEEALSENEAMLSCILNSLPIHVFWKDRDCVYLGCNETFARGAGLPPEEIVGLTDFDLPWSREESEAYRADDRAVMTSRQGKSHIIEQQHAADGSCIWLDTTKMPLFDSEGNVNGIVGIYDDITERKRIEDELHDTKDAAEAANRAKSQFLANMSHEIRTPMTAILGYADLFDSEDMQCPKCPDHERCEQRKQGQEAVAAMKRNGEHLLGVINDILDISKIEAGKFQIEPTRYSPARLTAEVISVMRPQAAAKQLNLQTELVGSLPDTILTDPLRLRQILVNLLTNAIKFTDEGEVRLSVRLTWDSGVPTLRFDVTDTGIGMDESQLKRLFKPFSQVDSSPTRKFGGTGLGLCISKYLIESLGGHIEVSSEPGKGSTFTLTIDPGPLNGILMIENAQETLLDYPQTASVAASDKIELRGRILLAEDGPDNQRLISFLLKKAGADVSVVENGQLAIEAAQTSLATGTPFDVILMDMQMPVLDGYEATRQLRALGYTYPIVALTAHAMAEDRQRCIDAGCDDYTSKPIERQKLLAIVGAWTSRSRA